MKIRSISTVLVLSLAVTALPAMAKQSCPSKQPVTGGTAAGALGLEQLRPQGRPMTVAERHILQHALLQGGNLLLQLEPQATIR